MRVIDIGRPYIQTLPGEPIIGCPTVTPIQIFSNEDVFWIS